MQWKFIINKFLQYFMVYLLVYAHVEKTRFFIIFCRFDVYLKIIIFMGLFYLGKILNLMHLLGLLNNISYFYHIFFVLFAFSKKKTTIIFYLFRLKFAARYLLGDLSNFFCF